MEDTIEPRTLATLTGYFAAISSLLEKIPFQLEIGGRGKGDDEAPVDQPCVFLLQGPLLLRDEIVLLSQKEVREAVFAYARAGEVHRPLLLGMEAEESIQPMSSPMTGVGCFFRASSSMWP